MYDRLKGFRDFYPEEMAGRRRAMDAVEASAARYGFREIDTPALERAQMYADKSGDEIVEEMYSFEDKGGRHVAMTPELTPTVARMVVDKGQELSKPIKWVSTRPFWRYEQVQQGRFREFYQTNVDVFGSSAPEADAEVLAVVANAFVDLGLTSEDFEFRVNHRDVLGGLLATFGDDVDTEAGIRAVDKSAKVEPEEYYDLLVDAGLTRDQASQLDDLLKGGDLDEIAAFAGTDRVREGVENLRAILAVTEDFGVREYCTLSLETARGLDYYTGAVFECFDSAGEVSRSIFGGGRYDDLIESFGGQPTPAVGIAPGYATLTLLLQRAGVWPEGEEAISTDYYVLQAGDVREEAARVARALRERDHVVASDVAGRSFGAQMDYADSINAETVVIVGERDLANDEVTIKDMETGDQTQVPVEDFPGDRQRPTYDDFA
ncbi:histidine--tRNA ligase [Halobacteriales archaeon QS_1_68_20]|nr:MAG: histidine--tRNA ligase [Halobacteriales archaeon QS_1_68_20]